MTTRILLISIFTLSMIVTTVNAFTPVPFRILRISERRTTMSRIHAAEQTNDFYDDLKRRIMAETNPYANIFAAASALDHEISTVHVISFALGTSRQGIHSIEFPKGSGNNVVLAFQSRDACMKFAEHLRAQHFFDPTPQEVFFDTLESFAEELGVFVQIVPEGVELLPPSNHVEKLGQHNRDLREQQNHLNYVFDMEDGGFEEDGLLEEEESFQ